MKVYKGTDKDMKCRGMQYEIGRTEKSDDAIRCGNKGFHSCEAPFDVLRYYPNKNGNRFFEATADGKIDLTDADDSKIASSEITLDAEISFANLVSAQIKYTRTKAESGRNGGDRSNLAGGDSSNLAGGYWSTITGGDNSNIVGGDRSTITGGDNSNIVGGDWSTITGGDNSNIVGGYWSTITGGDGSNIVGDYCSNIAGGDNSNIVGGDRSTIAGGYRSNLAGGYRSNLAGGDRSNLAGGDSSNLAGGDSSNLAGGDSSNLAGGDSSMIIGRNESRAKAGMNSVIVLTEWEWVGDEYKPVFVKSEIVDGERIKPDTWYKLIDGEFVEDE